jgi:hypothetical protein
VIGGNICVYGERKIEEENYYHFAIEDENYSECSVMRCYEK